MEFFLELLAKSASDMSMGRMLESLVVYAVVWSRLKPQLKKVTDELSQLKNAVTQGFNSGEQRFAKIETRLHDVELELKQTPKEARNGNFEQADITGSTC